MPGLTMDSAKSRTCAARRPAARIFSIPSASWTRGRSDMSGRKPLSAYGGPMPGGTCCLADTLPLVRRGRPWKSPSSLGAARFAEKLGETLLAGGDDEGARAAGRGVAGTARYRGGEGETAAQEGGALAARAGDGGAREGTGGDPAGRGETRHVATDGGGGHVRGRSATGYAAAEPIESHLRPSTPTRWVTTTRRIVGARISARRAIPSGGEEAFLE